MVPVPGTHSRAVRREATSKAAGAAAAPATAGTERGIRTLSHCPYLANFSFFLLFSFCVRRHICKIQNSVQLHYILQVLRAFGIPQRKHLYFISVSGAFLGTSLPPTPNWSRFDLFIDVYSIFTVFFTLFIVFLATHCILFIFYLPFLSLRVKL